jgi:hypothetical protein
MDDCKKHLGVLVLEDRRSLVKREDFINRFVLCCKCSSLMDFSNVKKIRVHLMDYLDQPVRCLTEMVPMQRTAAGSFGSVPRGSNNRKDFQILKNELSFMGTPQTQGNQESRQFHH